MVNTKSILQQLGLASVFTTPFRRFYTVLFSVCVNYLVGIITKLTDNNFVFVKRGGRVFFLPEGVSDDLWSGFWGCNGMRKYHGIWYYTLVEVVKHRCFGFF